MQGTRLLLTGVVREKSIELVAERQHENLFES